MSTDKLDRVTAIASRQPAINPARHQVSPAVLEFRLQQVTVERDELAALVLVLRDGINRIMMRATILPGDEAARECAHIFVEARALLAKIGPGKG